MIQICCYVCSILLTYIWYKTACNDKDFETNGKMLTFTNGEKITVAIYNLLLIYFVSKISVTAMIFATISVPYLIIAAFTDKKTKLVYDIPFYIFGIVAMIIESFMFQKFSISVIVIYLFAQLLASMRLFGQGDRAMTVVCGTIYFFMKPELTVIEALLANCIMILIAEVFFYIQAIKDRNLDGPFKLKESKPLGPDLCLATFITLIGATFI